MRKYTWFFVSSMMTFAGVRAQGLRQEVVTTLRASVLAEAAAAMKERPITVTAYHSDRSAGGIHDFFSEADYFWPNPASPDSPYVNRDGQSNPNNFVAHRLAMIRLSRLVGALGSAWLLTHDDKYVRQALDHCRAWFVDTATMMNPDLRFSQAVKGRATGRSYGIIDTIQLMEVVKALEVMEGSAAMDPRLLEKIKAWFSRYLQWLNTHPYGVKEMNAANNHSTCWLMQVAAFAHFTGDQGLLEFCRARYKTVLLPRQMGADGSFPLELRRTKPYGYSLFNLDAMAMLCQILSTPGDDLWHFQADSGKSVEKGIDFLYPYIADKSKWPYKHDIMIWDQWPVAQPALVFGALAFGRKDWLDTWKRLDHHPTNAEVIRNLPVRHPLIWLTQKVVNKPLVRKTDTLTRDERMGWWRDARFGMFIHWGVYSVLGGEYDGHQINKAGEWIMNRGKIPVAKYQKIAHQFNPVKYDPEAWVKIAKEAGMKYIVITAKHHDGFALFRTKASKWNVVDATVYGKDLLKPLAAACKKYGIKLGFYYSQAQDWNNPGGAAARKVASEGWANPDSAAIDAYTAAHTGHWDPAQTTESFGEYIDKVAVPQVRELLTNYGNVAVLWWDTPVGMTDEYAEKLHDLLALQPRIITNDRLKRPDFPGDYKTPEQKIPKPGELNGDWETCMTMNGTWGFKKSDHKWKTPTTLIHNLVDIASKGGNYLLNVGPTPEGEIPQPSVDALKTIGAWMKVNGEAIYGTKGSPMGPLSWGRCTTKGSTFYFTVFDWPADGRLVVPNMKADVRKARLLVGGEALRIEKNGDELVIHVPARAPDEMATVIKVD
ncbi:MAG TPA: alpha-L-fucosidase [Puia sp.]|nr:alpha-L-fucosidase [Puia sp.]